MSKIENGKPKIYYGSMKIVIPMFEILFKEEFARVNARISKLERKIAASGGPRQ